MMQCGAHAYLQHQCMNQLALYLLSLDHTLPDNSGMQSIKDFQNIKTKRNLMVNCFLGDFLIFLSFSTTWQGSIIMAYKHTSEEHLFALKFHSVQSVILFIEVLSKRETPILFIFKAFSTLEDVYLYIVLRNSFYPVPLFLNPS